MKDAFLASVRDAHNAMKLTRGGVMNHAAAVLLVDRARRNAARLTDVSRASAMLAAEIAATRVFDGCPLVRALGVMVVLTIPPLRHRAVRRAYAV